MLTSKESYKYMKTRIAIYLCLPLLLLGAGCAADELADDAVKPVEVPLSALDQAKELSADVKARELREADAVANLLPVAMVLPDGHEEPADGAERLADETFGCNDRIGYVRVSRETGTGDVLHDALNTLFAETEYTVGPGMLNSLPDSEIAVEKILYFGERVEIYLTGELVSPGVCADPRIKEQIEATVRQYHPNYEIILNGNEANWRCFGDGSGLCE